MKQKETAEEMETSSVDVSSRLPHTRLSVEIIQSEEEMNVLKDEWNELACISPSTIFQTFQWNRTWWTYFGAGKELHIFTVREDGRLIAVVPLFYDTVKWMNKKIYTRLRLLGSSVSQPEGEDLKGLMPYSDYLDAVIRPDYEEEVIRLLWYHLKQAGDYQDLVLDELPEQGVLSRYLPPLLRAEGVAYHLEESSACPVVELQDTWEDYLAHLGKRSRFHARKFIKKAYKEDYKVFDIEEVDQPRRLSHAFEQLVELHQKRWNQSGQPGVFAEKRYHRFLQDVSRQFLEQGWLQVQIAHALEEDNKPVAVDLAFRYKNRIYLVQRAFDVDSNSSVYGPGNVLLYDAIRKGIREGYTIFDFLRGTEAFKYRTAEKTVKNMKLLIKNPNSSHFNLVQKEWVDRWIYVRRRTVLEAAKFRVQMKEKGIFSGLEHYLDSSWSRLKGRLERSGSD